MKHLSSLMLILSAIILLSCHSTKSSVSLSRKSETVASTAHRLCSSWINDTTSQRLVLSADSMIFVFSNSENTFTQESSNGFSVLAGSESISPGDAAVASPDDMYFFSSKPPSKGNGKAQGKTNTKGQREASARRLTEQPMLMQATIRSPAYMLLRWTARRPPRSPHMMKKPANKSPFQAIARNGYSSACLHLYWGTSSIKYAHSASICPPTIPCAS